MLLEKLVNFLDKKYHHKRVIKFLNNYEIDSIIDVGSHKGEFLTNCIPNISFKKAYTFEPQKKIFKILIKKFNKDSRIKSYNIALGNKNKKEIININRLTSTSSLQKLNHNSFFLRIKNLLIGKTNIKKNSYRVKINTIDKFFQNKKLTNTLLKIDVEGYELNVLKGSNNTIRKIKLILIENQFFNMYKNNKTKNWHNFLVKKNFKLIKKFRFPLLHFEDRFYVNSRK
tara:strand:- start:4692 stop:5375 length:684 start_codon:yes stop_codon:yes gene_type:complete